MADKEVRFQKLYPEGLYKGEVTGHAFEPGREAGDKPVLSFTVKIIEFVQAKNGGPKPTVLLGATRVVTCFFNEDGINRTRALLKKLGYLEDVTRLDRPGVRNPKPLSLVGAVIELDCVNQKAKPGTKYAGQVFDRWYPHGLDNVSEKFLNKPPVSDDSLRGLRALWGSQKSTEAAAVKQTLEQKKAEPIKENKEALPENAEPVHEHGEFDGQPEPQDVEWD